MDINQRSKEFELNLIHFLNMNNDLPISMIYYITKNVVTNLKETYDNYLIDSNKKEFEEREESEERKESEEREE